MRQEHRLSGAANPPYMNWQFMNCQSLHCVFPVLDCVLSRQFTVRGEPTRRGRGYLCIGRSPFLGARKSVWRHWCAEAGSQSFGELRKMVERNAPRKAINGRPRLSRPSGRAGCSLCSRSCHAASASACFSPQRFFGISSRGACPSTVARGYKCR